jgi:hypothetical protein
VFLHQMPKHDAIRSRPVRDLHQMPRFDGQARFLAGLIHLMPDRPAGGVISGVRGDQRRAGRCSGPARLRRPGRPAERHAPLAQRDEGVVADHEVIEQLDVEQAAGSECLRGQVEVVR